MRVLIAAFGVVPGSNAHAPALVGMATALRGEVDMITLGTEGLAHLERFGDARMFRVPVSGSDEAQQASFGRAMSRQLEAGPYDVVHARGPHEGRVAAQRRASLGFRFVYEVATFPDEAEGMVAEARWAARHHECLEAADLVIVATEASSRFLNDMGHTGRVAVVPPGVDVNAFDWGPAPPDDATRLLYLGPFTADRDLHTVLGAIRAVRRDRPVVGLMAGEPDHARRHRLSTLVDAFGLSDVVTVRAEPPRRSLPSVIAGCTIGIVPASATPRFQEYGGLPEPLLEYMACRRPVIGAGVTGIAEIVRDEKESLLYVPGDEDTLAEAILSLVNSPALSRRLVDAAYERVRCQFSASARRRRIAEVYETVVPASQSFDIWSESFCDDMITPAESPSSLLRIVPDCRTESSQDFGIAAFFGSTRRCQCIVEEERETQRFQGLVRSTGGNSISRVLYWSSSPRRQWRPFI